MASFIGSGNVSNPMTSDLLANGFNITGGATYEAGRLETITIAKPAGSALTVVGVEDTLRLDAGRYIDFAPGAFTTGIKLVGGAGLDVEIDSIPAGSQPNVIGYDTATNKLYYQPAGGGGGGVASVSAGTNITITGTSTAPIVNLASPLTSTINVGTQSITTTTTNGDIGLTTNGTGAVHITTAGAGTNGAFRITQSSAGGSANPIVNLINNNGNASAPTMDFYKNSASVQAGDGVGTIAFHGKNTSGTKKEFARIEAVSSDINTGTEAGYINFSRLTGSGGALVQGMVITPTGVSFNNNPISAIGTATANAIVCPTITATNATYPKYDANTFEVKDDGIVSAIPIPGYQGETFTAVNAGRTPASWFSQLPNNLAGTVYCVIEFNGELFWGGQQVLIRTDYNGVVQQTYTVSGAGERINTLCVVGSDLYVGGDFNAIDGNTSYNIAYITTSNSVVVYLDNVGNIGLNAPVYSIRAEPSGGIIACGAFTNTGTGTNPLYRIARGTPGVAWFTDAIIDNNNVYDCVRFSSGGDNILLIGGDFTSFNAGNSCANIVGYNITTATYFPVGSSGGFSEFNGTVRCFTLKDASSEVYIAGQFTTINANPFLYSVYYNYSNLQNPINFDWVSDLYYIEWNAVIGRMLRGGGGIFGVDGTAYSGSPPFTIGLNIQSPQGAYYRNGANKTYIPSGIATANYAYVFEPTSYMYWSSAIPIVGASGNFSNVVSASQGNSFTLKANTQGTVRWFITANLGCTFS